MDSRVGYRFPGAQARGVLDSHFLVVISTLVASHVKE